MPRVTRLVGVRAAIGLLLSGSRARAPLAVPGCQWLRCEAKSDGGRERDADQVRHMDRPLAAGGCGFKEGFESAVAVQRGDPRGVPEWAAGGHAATCVGGAHWQVRLRLL